MVDGHAYAYRAFYAIRRLDSPAGVPTNAIFGFIKMLMKMRARLKPTHLAIAWDGGLAEERQALLPEYKAQRPPMPEDLDRQIGEICDRYLPAAGIGSRCEPQVEADDWIATWTRVAEAADAEVVIASSDKDFMQLVSPRVGLLNPNDKSESVWTAEQVRAKTGVEPGQIVDWLSLIGDSVDNIPGVPGVGPKTATELLDEFGSVDEMFGRLPEVRADKLRARLAEAERAVRRNQRMIRLRDDLPGAGTLADFVVRTEDRPALAALFGEWGFNSLRREFESAPDEQTELF